MMKTLAAASLFGLVGLTSVPVQAATSQVDWRVQQNVQKVDWYCGPKCQAQRERDYRWEHAEQARHRKWAHRHWYHDHWVYW